MIFAHQLTNFQNRRIREWEGKCYLPLRIVHYGTTRIAGRTHRCAPTKTLFHHRQHKIIRRQILKARQFDFHFGGFRVVVEVQFYNRGHIFNHFIKIKLSAVKFRNPVKPISASTVEKSLSKLI